MFFLHPTLAADTLEIASWDVSRVLLMKDANYPWLILVPAREGLSGLHELAEPDRALVMEEINRASAALNKIYSPDRINVAALGNVVEQLHIHVIARFQDDAAWPDPVWGAQPRLIYNGDQLERTALKLKAEL